MSREWPYRYKGILVLHKIEIENNWHADGAREKSGDLNFGANIFIVKFLSICCNDYIRLAKWTRSFQCAARHLMCRYSKTIFAMYSESIKGYLSPTWQFTAPYYYHIVQLPEKTEQVLAGSVGPVAGQTEQRAERFPVQLGLARAFETAERYPACSTWVGKQ